ncbi:BED zinc finger [Dictyocaulus viviparus]|uniref:BED zinc finger n=1 Tax=Dictyocaulus viviparus TaxID=29172 RepID=A0A0D8XH65_DICVI|nr:BED zinc finger [Dictyocaulus viviparus]
MADEVVVSDVLSSLLCDSPTDGKKKNQKSTKACKKSSEIWDHYRLLNENQNVECVYCWKVLKRGDSSTKSMWGHMTAFHQDILDDKQSRKRLRVMAVEPLERKKFTTADAVDTPTQPYVKRARAGANSQTVPPSDSVALAFQQLQSASQLNNTFNFLENLPKYSEVINISAGYPMDDDEQENVHEEIQAGSSGGSLVGDGASPLREDAATSGGSPSVTSTNHLSAFMNMATNPLMWNAMLVNTSTHGSAFSLNDGQCVSMLMKMALDLDLTLSYHKRRGDIELCFESNRTAEKSGGRGKVLCLSDMGREIRVIERVNGTPTDTEMWTKTDFNQFHWAIRGKCQKVLVKG